MRKRIEEFKEVVKGKVLGTFPHIILDRFENYEGVGIEEILTDYKKEKGYTTCTFEGEQYIVRGVRVMPGVRSGKYYKVTYNLEEISLIRPEVFAKTQAGLDIGFGQKVQPKRGGGKNAEEQVQNETK